ncbi:MBL fold metallo-hydrolase [Pseudomonas sp. LPB0260]|uniref:MBL fold metallo-hydrolase n=1 Tax=Pseudomonas sp. LPB0260 TaxID=2614442 RepID=UPI0015C2A23F|nr:MBL fold metallo-hydrolase [Pseudomonas sp. LPB0260]QLC74749.1 MBL fold metallo-hydrolase [Pseudomonas sp. LPB0260]
MRTLTTLAGNSQKLDGGAMFGNAPKSLWQRWMAADEQNRIDLGCRALLVQEDARNILIETGIGAFFSPELKARYGVQEEHHVLLDSLANAGLNDADIDIVLLTHLHFDHAGGLLAPWAANQPPRLLFPNARFVTGQRQWQRACNPHPRDRASYIPELLKLLRESGRLDLLEETSSSELLGDDWRLHWSDGHTPGQLLPEIAMPAGPVVFAGDLIPAAPWVHLPLTMGYDRFPEGLIEEKEQLLDHLVNHGRLIFTHDPQVAVGRVMRDDVGRYSLTDVSAQVCALTE